MYWHGTHIASYSLQDSSSVGVYDPMDRSRFCQAQRAVMNWSHMGKPASDRWIHRSAGDICYAEEYQNFHIQLNCRVYTWATGIIIIMNISKCKGESKLVWIRNDWDGKCRLCSDASFTNLEITKNLASPLHVPASIQFRKLEGSFPDKCSF